MCYILLNRKVFPCGEMEDPLMGSYATKISPPRAANSDMPLRRQNGQPVNQMGSLSAKTPDVAQAALRP